MKFSKKHIRYFQNILFSDKLVIKYKFKKCLGYFPDLKNPTTFNEKIQWLKLNDRSTIHTISADKYLARKFIAEILGAEYLVPLVYQTYDPNDITKENLTVFPCVIKVNHDSGGVIIVKDKSEMNWEDIRQFLGKKLKENYYYYGREWQYKNIKPCIIVEKLLLNKNDDIPNDYKVYCFNGIAKMISVDKDRRKSTKSRNWYDINWKKEDFHWNTCQNDSIIKKPEFFDNMINLSEKISKYFIFMRVDWYDLDGKLFIGELTLHPGSGYLEFVPNKWDKIFGDFLNLNT